VTGTARSGRQTNSLNSPTLGPLALNQSRTDLIFVSPGRIAGADLFQTDLRGLGE
jgi:hypothetical protein